jgi:hypothetical protein
VPAEQAYVEDEHEDAPAAEVVPAEQLMQALAPASGL